MIQALKTYLEEKTEDLGGESTKNLLIGVAVVVLVLVMYFYYQHVVYRTMHKHPLAAAAPPNPGLAAAATPDPVVVSTPYTPPQPAPEVDLPVSVPVATGVSHNSKPAKEKQISLGDSMLAAWPKTGTAETGMQSGKSAGVATTSPAARTPLKPQAPAAPLTEEQKLAKAAQDRFGKIIELAHSTPDAYGFTSDDKLEAASLGEAIPVYGIASADGAGYREGQPVNAIFKNTKEWLFPVMLHDRICFMVPVRRAGDQYTAGTGSRALAIVYEKIQARWPASQGYHPQLVVNPNRTGYFFSIPELPDQNLTDTSVMFQYNNPTLSPPGVILASWR